jgi:hypothetical protein
MQAVQAELVAQCVQQRHVRVVHFEDVRRTASICVSAVNAPVPSSTFPE